jgi:signal transduction histidine kinase
LLRAVDAERGLLRFQSDQDAGPQLAIGRSRQGEDWSPQETWRDSLVDSVRETGEAWPPRADVAEIVLGPFLPESVDATRVLALPLFLRERAVGAICLERSASSPAFTTEERDLLVVLSYQVPISIELARLLAEREQLQGSLQQAQKMEAVGQLASSVAHDFANMLTAVRGSVAIIDKRVGLAPDVAAELEVISGATDRAGRLMRQLLGFSQHQAVVRVPSSINDLILDLEPMLERLGGDDVRLVMTLDPDTHTVSLERASFDQVLVNLVLNARDAMAAGGTLTIETRNVVLDEAARRRGAPTTGEHIVVEVADTGHGIPPESLARIFDPFFTTKPPGGGTGIGLTTAYAFVKSSGGHIDVASEVGRGTTFRLYFPKADDATLVEPRRAVPPLVGGNGGYARARRFDPGSSTG